jgi:DNA-binding response OmpR family regulator
MMPKMSGLDVLENVRKSGSTVPVLLLTAKSEPEDIVEGLDSGADDYLTKPFTMSELLARLRAMTRRVREFVPNELKFGDVTLSRSTYEMSTAKGTVRLGNKEFQMMEYLMANHGMLISTEKFMEKIWGYDTETEISVVWVYISYLRKKLREIESSVIIKASRGAGYMLAESDA